MLELQPSKAWYFTSVVEIRSQAKCQRFHNCADIQCNTAPFRVVLPYSLDSCKIAPLDLRIKTLSVFRCITTTIVIVTKL